MRRGLPAIAGTAPGPRPSGFGPCAGRSGARSRLRGRLGGTSRARRAAAAGPSAAWPTSPGATPSTCGPRQRLGIRRSTRVPLARDDVVRRRLAGRAALEADGRLALASERTVVGLVQPAERLVVGRVVALGVVRTPPEDASRASCATRHEVPVGVLGARDLERQGVRRRRALTLDVVALGVTRAAEERSEPAA